MNAGVPNSRLEQKRRIISWKRHALCDAVLSYRIYSNKRRGADLIFRATIAALIRGRRLFKNCTRQIYFFYIFIQRYTFYLSIFLWTDAKLIVNLELREKFMRWKNPERFITRAEKYSHFELKNITFKEYKLPMLC